MTNKEKIEYLKQYIKVNEEIKVMEASWELYLSRITSVTAKLSDMPMGGCAGDKIGNDVVKLECLRQVLEERLGIMISVRSKILNAITDIKDSDLRQLMILRYLDDLKWEEVAVRMNYSWRQTHNLHSKALNKITI